MDDRRENGGRKAVDAEMQQQKAEAWKAENAEAMKAWGEWIKKNGLPLEKYRMFSI